MLSLVLIPERARQLVTFKNRMGWHIPWVSSAGGD